MTPQDAADYLLKNGWEIKKEFSYYLAPISTMVDTYGVPDTRGIRGELTYHFAFRDDEGTPHLGLINLAQIMYACIHYNLNKVREELLELIHKDSQ